MIRKVVLLVVAAAIFSIGSSFGQDTVVRPGDQVSIRLGGVLAEDIGQVSGVYQVDGQGYINMPHIGAVLAAGQTQSSLERLIEGAYKSAEIYTRPTITVNLSAGARLVNVTGDVKSPQRITYTPDMTLVSAIASCGGFSEYADQSKIRLVRDEKITIINFKEIRKDPRKDVRILPGDTIEVPRSFW